MKTRSPLAVVSAVSALACGCVAQGGPSGPSPDGADEPALAAGKADGSSYEACELDAVVAHLNALEVDGLEDERAARDTLLAQGVHGSAAKCLVWYRLGYDTTESCPGGAYPADAPVSPTLFEDIQQVDDVKYVGPTGMRQLVATAGGCEDEADEGADAEVDVVFSPAPTHADSHAAEIVERIDRAERSIDIAMYSFSEPSLIDALERNADRLRIRVIYDDGHLGRGLETALEEAGIEVRATGHTMHHKFALIDGPQSPEDDPAEASLATGSANWSTGAVDTYDETTFFVGNSPEIAYRYQREFNLLWRNSDPVPGHEEIEHFVTMPITDEMLEEVEDPAVDAIFTSRNFREYSDGLTVHKDGYDVAQRWIDYIEGAEESIWLYQERLRSVPIANALLDKALEDPEVEIRVFADNQEYVSYWSAREDHADLESCYEEASTEIQHVNCETGMYYSYDLAQAFEDNPSHSIRLSYYSYNWHYTFPQMHHKSMLVDGRWLVTGSYNLSFNAEFKTFENVLILDVDRFPELRDAVVEKMQLLWTRGAGEYEELMATVNGDAPDVPIRFDPMSISWHQVDAYRDAAREACGNDQLWRLKREDERAWTCERN